MNIHPVPSSPTPGSSGTGMTRRKLLWSLGVVTPLVTLTGGFALWKSRAAPRPPDSGLALSSARQHTRLATRAAAAGELERTREECTAALAEVPGHAPALIVLACTALEAGDLPAAQEVLVRLTALAPGQPELLILEKLLANQRRGTPAKGGRLHSAFPGGTAMLGGAGVARLHGCCLRGGGADARPSRCAPAALARNQREAFAREDELHAAVMTSLRAALDRWPMRSLSEQSLESRARSEVAWLRAFVGKGALP